jgi:uroporphyrinogen-III synthase
MFVARAPSPATLTMSKVRRSAGNQPLQGVRVLVGRARHQAGALSAELRKLGAQVLEIPFIEIRKPRSFQPLDSALKSLDTYDWLILTSVNGVEALFERLAAVGLDADALQHFKIAAIGPATEQAIADRGLVVDVVPNKYVAEEVVRILRPHVRGQRVLLVRAKVARDVIPVQLTGAGASVDVVEAYQTVTPEESKARLQEVFADKKRQPEFITFTSASTVQNFLALIVGTDVPGKLTEVKFASIGPVTSETLQEYGLPAHIEAEDYSMEGLVEAITQSVAGHD